jgi:uncharacterized membrane protein (Fun14 family)
LAGSACAGALLGMAVGWCVNAAMVEISINSIFAAYFGLFFCALAGVIAVRVSAFSAGAHRPALLVLAALMGASGLLCLAYQRHWFFSLAGGARVPIYALIGVSLAFALTFATAELLNYAAGGGSGLGGGGGGEPGGAARARAALVQTPTQVILLAVASVLLGLVYGLMFGSAEIGRGVFTLHTLRVRRRAAARRGAARRLLRRGAAACLSFTTAAARPTAATPPFICRPSSSTRSASRCPSARRLAQ